VRREAAFVILNLAGGYSYFWRKTAVKYSMLLKPEVKAMSATGKEVLRKSMAACCSLVASRYWCGEVDAKFLNSLLK
jgi:hypothetical protein